MFRRYSSRTLVKTINIFYKRSFTKTLVKNNTFNICNTRRNFHIKNNKPKNTKTVKKNGKKISLIKIIINEINTGSKYIKHNTIRFKNKINYRINVFDKMVTRSLINSSNRVNKFFNPIKIKIDKFLSYKILGTEIGKILSYTGKILVIIGACITLVIGTVIISIPIITGFILLGSMCFANPYFCIICLLLMR